MFGYSQYISIYLINLSNYLSLFITSIIIINEKYCMSDIFNSFRGDLCKKIDNIVPVHLAILMSTWL